MYARVCVCMSTYTICKSLNIHSILENSFEITQITYSSNYKIHRPITPFYYTR